MEVFTVSNLRPVELAAALSGESDGKLKETFEVELARFTSTSDEALLLLPALFDAPKSA